MAGPYRGSEQLNRLLGKSLAHPKPFRRSHSHVGPAMMLELFAIYLSPLGLMADREQRRLRYGLHIFILPLEAACRC
jgi:hypothetical protein